VLAAVTSLPNAVAAVYLAARGRGHATLSTALNSNTLNVVAGLLLPATVIGLGRPSGQAVLVTAWYVALTLAVLGLTYRDRGLGRGAGSLVIAAYAAFAVSVLASGYVLSAGPELVTVLAVLSAVALTAGLVPRRKEPDTAARQQSLLWPGAAHQPAEVVPGPGGNGRQPARGSDSAPGRSKSPLSRESLLPGWTVARLWVLSLALSVLGAGVDAALGRVVLIGLVIVGPCAALLTGRWVPTALTGLWATGLAVTLGLPDRIWGTPTHLAFLAAVAAVALATTIAAALISTAR